MYFKKSKIFLAIALSTNLLFSSSSAFAQHSILDRFYIVEVNGEVHIDCVIGFGNTCNGIDLLRSEDSIQNFEIIEQISGVCGSSSTPVTYNFIDENPIKNKTTYYKLRLGLTGYSHALPIQVVDTEEFGFQIRPNPASERVFVYFKNKPNTEHTITLFNNIGMPAFSQKTMENFFELDLSDLNSGIYTFSISRTTIMGRLQVQH